MYTDHTSSTSEELDKPEQLSNKNSWPYFAALKRSTLTLAAYSELTNDDTFRGPRVG